MTQLWRGSYMAAVAAQQFALTTVVARESSPRKLTARTPHDLTSQNYGCPGPRSVNG
jgi:hypothetical protein